MRASFLLLFAALTLLAAAPAVVAPFPRSWFWGFPEDLERFARMVGKPAPALEMTGWVEPRNEPPTLKGKIVVLDFFATWCPPCVDGVPKMNAFHERWREKGVQVVGVCTSDVGQEKLGEFVATHRVQYPAARDPGTKTMQAWGIQTFPTYAVLDRNGVVRAVGLKQAFLNNVVERLLAEDDAKRGEERLREHR